MRQTPTDLYRFGRQSKLDKVRADPDPLTRSKDAVSYDRDAGNGVTDTWVRGLKRGVSCFSAPNNRLKGIRGKWWKLPQGTSYDDRTLYLYSPDGSHWYWAPAEDMRLSDFEAHLAQLNPAFG
jgi:hypothetical protein